MRNTKKAISILLTLLMVVGMMSTFAFAETKTGTITIENPQKDAVYTAYKVFALTYSGTNYSYTIDENDEWYKAVATYANEKKDLSLNSITGTKKYIVNFTGDSTAELAKSLKTWYEKNKDNLKNGKNFVDSETKKTVTGLELGYYFVNSTAGSLCMLNSTDPTADIYDKTEKMPFEKKVNNAKSVTANIGDELSYTLKTKVPSTEGYKVYNYVFEDKLPSGIDLKSDTISVSVGGTPLESDKYNLNTNVVDNDGKVTADFKITINMKQFKTVDAEVIVSYKAVLNKDAADINTNTAKLIYNNPDESTDTLTDTATVTTGSIQINKLIAGTKTPLNGAEFVLKNKEGKFYSSKEENGVFTVTWVEEKSQATKIKTGNLTEDLKGVAIFKGIAVDNGYEIIEENAPEGYNKLKASVSVTDFTAGTSTSTITNKVIEIENSTGTELPSTGGIGTTIFYLIGAILVIGAGVVFVTRRRMHSDK